MMPSLFSIFLDYWCNFECKHCSVGSSPRTILPMPREILDKAFEGLKAVPTAKVVVFTGGEPTLRLEMLLEGIRMAKEKGLRVRIVTNGWWASSIPKAQEMVGKLKAAGLDEINTSYDDFHMPFTKFNRIVNLVRVSHAAGLAIGMGVIADNDAKYNTKTIRAELSQGLGIPEDELDDYVTILEDKPAPTGTGASLDVSQLDAGKKLDLGCAEVMKTISIHPNGGVKVCCGHAMFYAKDLNLGNLNDESLTEMLKRGQGNLLYWWLHMLGPKRILEKIGVKGTYSHICHACNELLTKHRDAAIEYLVAHRNDVMANDVLLSDTMRHVAQVVLESKEDILARVSATAKRREIPLKVVR
jgi:organic radical activating enzyme